MRSRSPIKFCTHCGNKIVVAIPPGDNRERHLCRGCGEIQYQNPKIIAGCIPVWQDRLLICKRAIEPRLGWWTIPAGFMENDETIEQGAVRETWEEACAKVTNLELFQIYNLTTANQVYMLFRAEMVSQDGYDVGAESLEVKMVEESEIPWDEIAFPVIHHTLQRFFAQRSGGQFTMQIDTL